MNFSLFLFFLIGIQGVCLYIGRRGGGKVEDRESYFLAGRSLKVFPLMMTFIATQIGGGVLLGAAEEAFCYGYGVILYPLGVALGLIFLGMGPGKRLAAGSLTTVVAIFEVVYGSKKLRRIAFLLSAGSLFFILVAQVIALDRLFNAFAFGKYLTLAFWIVLALYTSTGGFRGVVRTDIIQAGFLLLAVVCCGISVWFVVPQSLPLTEPFQPLPYAKLSNWILMPMLFMIVEQDMVQRCVAASSPQRLQWAAVGAGVTLLIFNFVPLFLGSLGAKVGIVGGCPLIDTIAYFCGPSLAAVMAAAIGVAILSTADSLMNAVAQLIAEELPTLKAPYYRYLIWGLAVLAPLAAVGFTNIVDVLILSYSLSVCCLSVPVGFYLLAPKGSRLSKAGAWAGVIVGGVGYGIVQFVSFGIFGELFAWISSLVAFSLVQIIDFSLQKKKLFKVLRLNAKDSD
ncbi:Pantothenate permease,sodium/panthothenate symporter,Na /panthothenate symporter,transporter, solute:sodium symporter (SSS) family,Sodium:solute symporter family [Chlamydia serpentis]|uniref:Pantothenate permease,sodium/panthothenate symporter,Na /panthothenate symporter,transporter, solute:sodium symporter (SSS) family,Sodium:solute symporter family n=1 Tax=Chlamydia serpentis TaxID=1967782 RepID=A0A2R8FB10_9CHLA|nr:sodium:solute symporter family protein [Chlamydia serpentis]SPN73609.1 Pantothenate permease,sodium/panthothenate symporter,Na /panthothenate symporter,transporter, solute:sodium symporter (SSS) family,Sodium:solute symporter family [Chlamydia serpentis]